MKTNSGQLMIDFSIPAVESLTVPEISAALGISTSKIYAAIENGDLTATTIHDEDADRMEWRVPRNNFYCWLNNEYPECLLYRYPRSDWLEVPRIAKFLNCSEPTVHKHIAKGEFPNAENIGTAKKKHWRVPLMDLVDFTYRRRAEAIC